jgi:PAS domain S-box-containing protein
MKANRSYLFRFNWDKTEFRISHLWEDEGVPKDQTVRGEIVRDIFPWLYENLIKGKDIIISDVAELPGEEARSEYEYCRQIGIQSFIVLPVQVANAPLCAIGLDSIQIKRKWSMEVKERLRLIGEIFANAVERKHSESRTKAAELKYRTVADYTYDWEYWSHIDGSLEYVSPSCERISGYSVQDFKENPALLREIIVPEDKKSWDTHKLKAGKRLKPEEVQFRIHRKDGKIRWIEHVCQPVRDPQGVFLGFRASNRDVTARIQAELDAQKHRSEMTHISRIATLGELSASLAHELNQPLTAILSNAQAARRFLTGNTVDPDEVNEILNDIINDDKRAADMIKRLRTLMRKKELEFTSLDLNKVIRGVSELANREAFTKDVPLVLELADGLPQVRGDVIHLEQVILNLILNGCEAMADLDHQSRELRILTANHDENAVRVSLRDQGTGIDEGHMTNIFEAFYTTKPEGMGMGLSICRSIIEAHGGRLWAENNPDKGATVSFTVQVSRD